jgi:hypothetical protein
VSSEHGRRTLVPARRRIRNARITGRTCRRRPCLPPRPRVPALRAVTATHWPRGSPSEAPRELRLLLVSIRIPDPSPNRTGSRGPSAMGRPLSPSPCLMPSLQPRPTGPKINGQTSCRSFLFHRPRSAGSQDLYFYQAQLRHTTHVSYSFFDIFF